MPDGPRAGSWPPASAYAFSLLVLGAGVFLSAFLLDELAGSDPDADSTNLFLIPLIWLVAAFASAAERRLRARPTDADRSDDDARLTPRRRIVVAAAAAAAGAALSAALLLALGDEIDDSNWWYWPSAAAVFVVTVAAHLALQRRALG